MVVITTHTNADFDSLASMAAALLLYPGAKLVFPGACEALLRRYLEEHSAEFPEILPLRSLDLSLVERLICVDVSDRGRLGDLASLLDRDPPVLVEVYDHHAEQGDISPSGGREPEAGACATVMVQELRKRGIEPEAGRATLFILGIYEDTGFLSFPTTRPADFEAVRQCLLWGADLTQVSRVLHRRLSETQVRILTKLMERMETLTVGGVNICLTTYSSPEYVPDLALLVHELFNLEALDALFLLAGMENRVHIIGRSRVPQVDAARALVPFGGGGHPSAASASVKGPTLEEARRLLVEELTTGHPVGLTAREIFQRDFRRIAATATVQEAFREMNNRRVNALPVFEGTRLVGVITRQEVDGALQHGLPDQKVTSLVATAPPLLPSDTPVESVRRLMLERSWRVVLFGESPDRVEGLLSRMALFKSLYQLEPTMPHRRGGGIPSRVEIQRLLAATFSPEEVEAFRALGELAERRETPVLLVGGAVRDLLLRRPVKDVDFVVEGDAVGLAEAWAVAHGGRVRVHREFGTAIWLRPDGATWDFATARAEYYDAPAALPTVAHAALSQDLYRRDFTFNALALHLAPGRFGEVLDLFGGVRDLKAGQIRVLHGLSFVEDPTRAFRAVRFAVTLRFTLPSETEGLTAAALKQGVFKNLSPKRVLNEIRQLLAGADPVESLRMLERCGLLRVFWPALKLTPKVLERLNRVQKVADHFEVTFPEEPFDKPSLFILALTERLTHEQLAAFRATYPFPRLFKELLDRVRVLTWRARQRLALHDKTPGAVYRSLSGEPLLWVLYLQACLENPAEQALVRDFLVRHRFTALAITGADLKAAGLKPSPAFAEALFATRVAKADGLVATREEELAFAVKAVATFGSSQGNSK